ncbi:MAG: hypothetical protein M3Q95_12190 [Bacteroidota bacterium]|nr:hypothetical protein [Bacteroidota bacterium]
MKKLIYLTLIVVTSFTIFVTSCKDDETIVTVRDTVEVPIDHGSLPNQLGSATNIDTVAGTAVLPLYRGQDANGGNVYYIITESNNVDISIALGLNWTPKLVHAIGTIAVQTATIVTGGTPNPNNFPILKFPGNVDFSPTRIVVAGPDTFPLDPSSQPGSVGDALYSPLVKIGGQQIVYNASHLQNSTGTHNRVISMDIPNRKVTMRLAKGFYEGFPILYSTTETSDNDIAALEDNTFAPNMNAAPFPGDDKSFRSAREALIPVVNGPLGVNNPQRQGLKSAVLGEGDPLNIFQEQAGCENPDDPGSFCDAALYSPLWDVHPVVWTPASIAAGLRVQVRTDKFETIAPINIIELYADGHIVAGDTTGKRNSSLGGLNASGPFDKGLIVNCPIIFVPADALRLSHRKGLNNKYNSNSIFIR